MIRSLGGGHQILALRRAGEKAISDERILGSGTFVDDILKELNQRTPLTGSIDLIIEEECLARQVTIGELQAGSRRNKVTLARAIIAQKALHGPGLSSAAIARYLGVNTSSITKAIEKREKREQTELCKL